MLSVLVMLSRTGRGVKLIVQQPGRGLTSLMILGTDGGCESASSVNGGPSHSLGDGDGNGRSSIGGGAFSPFNGLVLDDGLRFLAIIPSSVTLNISLWIAQGRHSRSMITLPSPRSISVGGHAISSPLASVANI